MTTDEAAAAPPRRRPGARILPLVVVLLAVLATAGWFGWLYVGTNLVAQYHQLGEKSRLRDGWRQATISPTGSAGATSTGSGQPLALLRIPAFGAAYEVPVLSGTGLDVLDRGVGHYSSTALPGQVGNFAVVGHRATHGKPFGRLLELQRGDQVIVETRTAVYTYVLDVAPRELTVRPRDSWVLDPVPGRPEATPSQALLTLTTDQDRIPTADRSVGFGHLASTRNKG